MLPLAMYLRVSRVGDREHLISPELQAERVRSYAAARGLPVAEVPPELDISGGDTTRPVLDDIISGIGTRFGGVIVAQIDRLSRMDLVSALQTIRRIEEAGGQVVAVAESFDVGTPEGRMGRNVFLALGEMQLDRYKSQFAIAKERAVRNGIWPLPHTPLGYKRGADRKLTPDRTYRIGEAFEARANGASWDEVADILGKPLSTTRRVLGNRVYLGEINYGPLVNRKAHVPLVSRATWEAVQVPRRPTTRSPALLSGLVRCAGCQGRMTKLGRVYGCQGRVKVGGQCGDRAFVSRARLDELVVETLFAHLGEVSISASERSKIAEEDSRALSDAESELLVYQETIRVSDLGADNFLAGMRSRVEAVELARRKLAGLRVEVPVLEDLGWSDLSLLERRHVLSRCFGAVFVKRGSDRVRVLLDFEPPRMGAPVEPLTWPRGYLDGEVRVASTKHLR